LSRLIQKVEKTAREVPQELLGELEYSQR